MHNKILFPLSIAAVALGIVAFNISSVSAKETKDGIDYWSVKEMMSIKTEVEKEESDTCGNDYFCRQDWFYEQLDSNNKYRALENFQMDKLIPTSINPSTNTVKLFYQNEDSLLTHMLGRPRESQIEDFYMLWVEEQLGNPLKNGSWLTYGERYPYFLGDHASVESASHLMIDEDKGRNGVNWFTPNIEREYTITNSNLSDNTARRFYYSLLEDNGGRTNGIKDYNSCFDADYHEGMECRYMYGEDGSSRYFPFEPVSNSPESNTDEKEETVPESDTHTDSSSSTNSDNQTLAIITKEISKSIINKQGDETRKKEAKVVGKQKKESKGATSKPVILQIDQRDSEQSKDQSSESTSTNTSRNDDETTQPLGTSSVELPKAGGCEKEIIFPWWFIILVLVCDFLLMWFFWPKKSEKRVDKRVN